ncbi:MAG TPA: magnesium/cobalt transporter CorA, partial [Pseudonocardia sp.]|nr:magnesium/cobalt transporter CorA [Pseudonocardia sp.]
GGLRLRGPAPPAHGAGSGGAGPERSDREEPVVPVVDNAVYVDGRRELSPASLDQTFEALRSCPPGKRSFCWIGMLRPTADEIEAVAKEFGLHELAVEDTVHAHQRPKLERYDETVFVVLRPGRYVDPVEVIELGEVHLFLGPGFVITVRHAEQPDLALVRRRLEADPELLAHGPFAVLYAVLDRVVDDYGPVLDGLQNDVDQIEEQVFDGDPAVSRRIYQLTREVIAFQRAVEPLRQLLVQLRNRLDTSGEDTDLELRRALRDVADHATSVTERTEGYRQLLTNILTVNASLVAQRQNDEMARMTEAGYEQNEQVKRISSWAAILFAPTLVASVYGMNFTRMPELAWPLGYPMALLLMALLGIGLYAVFKRRGWL